MNEQEIGTLIMVYGFVAIVCAAALWLGQRDERKFQERMRREGLYKVYEGMFGKEVADRMMAKDKAERERR